MADGGGINLRLSLQGAEQIRSELASIGPAGAKMSRELDRAMRTPTAGVRALDTGVKQARNGLDEFASRSGAVGNVLMQFGPWGLAASAGLAAVAVAAAAAIKVANEAAAFAADLTDSAERIGIGTEALQEWRYIADEAGVPVQALEADLEKLNGVLGRFKRGIGDAKLKPWFQELGISKADLDSIETADQLMVLLADRLGQVKDRATQVAAAKALGVEASLPALRLGSERLEEMMKAAQDLGVVLDRETITKLDAADRKAELAGQQLKMMAYGALEPLATALANTGQWFGNLFAQMEKVDGLIPSMTSGMVNFLKTIPGLGQIVTFVQAINQAKGGAGANVPMDEDDPALLRQRMAIQGASGQQSGFDLKGHSSGGGGGGGGPSKAEREAEQNRKDAERELERLRQREIDEGQSYLRNLVQRGDTAEERSRSAEALAQNEHDEETWSDALLAKKIEAAGLMTDEVRDRIANIAGLRDAARSDAERRRAKEDADRIADDIEQRRADTMQEVLELAAGEARTSGERRSVELQLLALAQRRQRADLESALEAEKEPAVRAALVEAIGRLPDIFAAQERDVRRQTAGPVEAWRAAQPRSAAEASDRVTGQALDALDNLNGGLLDAWKNADNAGDAFANMGKVAVDALSQVADALLKIALQRMLIEPLGNALFGSGQSGGSQGLLGSFISNFTGRMFGGASGTSTSATSMSAVSGLSSRLAGAVPRARGGVSGAAGLHRVGEYGMEFLELPVGSRVYDADRSQQIMLDADARMRSAGGSGQGGSPVLGLTVINKGEPMKATMSNNGQGGQPTLTLEPIKQAMRGVVREMGSEGSLMGSLQATPQPRRR